MRGHDPGLLHGQKARPGGPVDTAEYKDLHEYVAPAFAPFTDVLGFEDALLVADDGRVIFGAKLGREVGEDIKAGPWPQPAWRQPGARPCRAKPSLSISRPIRPWGQTGRLCGRTGQKSYRDHDRSRRHPARARRPLAAIMGQGDGETFGREFALVGADGGVRLESDGHASRKDRSGRPGQGYGPVAQALAGETGNAIGADAGAWKP